MKKNSLLIIAALTIGSPAWAADNQPKELSDLLQKTEHVNAGEEEKIRALKEEAMVLGGVGGFVYECRYIVNKIEARAPELNKIYNFQSLLTREGMMLPVIEEVKDKVVIEEEMITSSGATYRIVKPARFVRVSPTFRDYLLNGLNCDKEAKKEKEFSFKLKTLAPKVWDEGIKLGWEIGRERALATHEDNLAKLNRDYLGMIKFRRLEMLGAIQMPTVSHAQYGSRIGKDKIEAGVRSLKIEKQSKFSFDATHWQPEVGIEDEPNQSEQNDNQELDNAQK